MKTSFWNLVRFGAKDLNCRQTIDAESILLRETSVPGALDGNLTSRTSNSSGTLALAYPHGISTGNPVDVYWFEAGLLKRRYGMTAGSVYLDTVPISGGSGDNLPAIGVPLRAMKPVELPFVVSGNLVAGLAAFSRRMGTFTFQTASGTALVWQTSRNPGLKMWSDQSNPVNPVADQRLTKVLMSHYFQLPTMMRVIAAIPDATEDPITEDPNAYTDLSGASYSDLSSGVYAQLGA